MKRTILLTIVAALFCNYSCQQTKLSKPSDIQYKWHEQERLMFIHFAPNTWTEREQDDNSVPLERINPVKLDTDQWCEAAIAWGAKQIVFVAKHTGGFCWWQTETTDYGIRNTPYKNGEGDVFKELAESCKKYDINLGVYIYPGDRTWGAGIGSGGKTEDPSKQDAYNKVFRAQLTEVLTRYGDMMEVWFDGSCYVDVSDILAEYAKKAVIFQGPQATIRWPGTEGGTLFYPAWNSIRSEDLKTGVSTQIHGTPDGDAWAPLETDTPLYAHHWFWSSKKAKDIKPLKLLMEYYYKSVGYGAVLLLNSTPDTSGLIPDTDIKRYEEFGEEIDRRFKIPISELQNKKGKKIILELPEPKKINHIITMEDYREGERIREYVIEGLSRGKWVELIKGSSVGRKKIDYFDEVEVSAVRLNITKAAAKPLIRSLSLYYVDNFIPFETKQSMRVWARPVEVTTWSKDMFKNGKVQVEVELSNNINVPGQYTLLVIPDEETDIKIDNPEIYYQGTRALDEFVVVSENKININQTAQITDKSKIIVKFSIESNIPHNGKVEFQPAVIY